MNTISLVAVRIVFFLEEKIVQVFGLSDAFHCRACTDQGPPAACEKSFEKAGFGMYFRKMGFFWCEV